MSLPADKLVFFGTDAFSVPCLVRLLAEGWHVAAVVTKPDTPGGRGQAVTAPAVKRLAEARAVPVLQPQRLADARDDLAALGAGAGIVVAYGKIIPSAIIDLFPKGLINVHASLLPRHRGASPIEAALLHGDAETGVTLMQIDRGLDTGPTYDAAKLQLAPSHNRPSLYAELAELGADLLAAKLPAILDGTIIPIPQDNTRATTTNLIQKSDGLIDWHKPAEQLKREVQAYLGWPGSRTHLAGADVTVTAAHVSPKDGPAGAAYRAPSGELAVYAAIGSLVIDRLTPAGKRDMAGPEFLAGHPLN